MLEALMTRVSPHFEALGVRDGVVVASTRLEDTYGFTELGYDRVAYHEQPRVLWVVPRTDRIASREDLARVVASVEDEIYPEDLAQYGVDSVDEMEANQLLGLVVVRTAMNEAGWDAVRTSIVVSNTEPTVTIFWRDDAFVVTGAVAVVSDDPAYPHRVRLEDEPTAPSLR